jgi:hypothetical protein
MGVILSTAKIMGIAYGIKISQYATKYSMKRHHGKERQPSEEQSSWKKKLEKTKTVQSQKIFKGETPSKTSMEKHYNNETQKSWKIKCRGICLS